MSMQSAEAIREPAVAGLFYPDAPLRLDAELERHLRENPASGPVPKVLVVPHAGYPYSGPVAARAYNLLEPVRHQVKRVVLLGPSHRWPLDGIALPGCDAFATPLGTVTVDRMLAWSLEDLPQVTTLPEAHAEEHSLEVELPFLQRMLEHFTLLPLVVGRTTPEQVAAVLERVWGGDETLIVISTDLSHYHPYEEAQRIDRETSRLICDLRAELGGEQACGAFPLNGLLWHARRLGLQAELLDLRNSGDTAGDRHRVVGYGAFVLY